MITSKICFIHRLILWWQSWNINFQREAAETQYKGYLSKLSPMRREHELRRFIAKVMPGYHVQGDPRRG